MHEGHPHLMAWLIMGDWLQQRVLLATIRLHMKKRWPVDSGRLAKCHGHMHEGCPHLAALCWLTMCDQTSIHVWLCLLLKICFGNPVVFKRLIEDPSYGRDRHKP